MTTTKKKKATNSVYSSSFLDKSDAFFDQHDKLFFWILFGITFLFGMLLYDPGISLTGDDSAYILRANNFIKHFSFPDYQGPLYPIVLSILAFFFKISLFPLKMLSMASMLGFVYFTFIAFRKKIPATLLFVTLLLTAINSFVLYYASQTYSEAFYMFMQSLVLFVFLRFFIPGPENITWKIDIKRHAWLALAILGVALTRSVGFSALIAIVGYFLLYRQWKNLALSIVFFCVIFLVYQGIKSSIWHDGSLQFSGQSSMLLNKNPYHAEYGKETFSGFVDRLLGNSKQYLSKDLFVVMGIKKAAIDGGSNEGNTFSTVLIYALAILSLIFSFKKNKSLFFTGLLTGAFLFTSFIVLQVFWNQDRLIIPAYPLILMVVFAAFYYLLRMEKFRSFQFLFFLPVIILFFTGMGDTIGSIKKARKLTDMYSGLTIDWKNYAMASRWAGENLKETDLVACRKAPMSMIYSGGKEFYGIYTVPSGNFNAFLKNWETNKFVAFPFDNQMSQELFLKIQPAYVAHLTVGNMDLLIVNHTDSVQQVIAERHINVVSSPDVIRNAASTVNNQVSVLYADSLLAPFKQRGVTHVLTANIGMNTVERYLYYIQEKYPYLFEQVKQIGNDNQAPATIIKIRWDLLKNN